MWIWLRDRTTWGRAGLRSPSERGRRSKRLSRARRPAPLSPAGLPGPRPGRGCCRWGSPLSLPLFSAGLQVFTHPRFRRRDEVFQNVIPSCQFSSSLRLRGSRGRRGSHPPSLTNHFALLRMANCAEGQSRRRSHTVQWLPGCFGNSHRTGWDCPSAGSWCSVARGAVEQGPESLRHVSFQCFFCSLIGAQINDRLSCFQI